MTYWEKYISEEMTAAQKKKAAEEVMSDLTGKNKKKKGKKDKAKSEYTEYLKKQLEYKRQKYEDQKKREIEKRKERAQKSSDGKARQALSSIKQQTISYKDTDPTAYAKAVENVASAASGVGKALYYALKSRSKKRKAEKEPSKQPEKKKPGKPGRPKAEKKETKKPEQERTPQVAPRPDTTTPPRTQRVSVRDVTPPKKPRTPKKIEGTPERKKLAPSTKKLEGTPERKKLVPSTKRLPPATKRLPPSGGAPSGGGGSPSSPEKETGMTLGQKARKNPALKAELIKSRMEQYSNWKEEFLFEIDDKVNKVEKKKVIDIMNGKNNIEMNPNVMEDHKEISSGKKKDDEGYMANVELDQMERAIKALRKKVKRSDMQLPAWVQSKITRAADYIDTASEYLQSEEGLSEEKEEKRYCKLCRRKEAKGECSYGPSMWEKYTISEMAPVIATLGRVALGAGARHGAKAALASTAKDIAKEKIKRGVQSSLERAGQRVRSNGIFPEDGGASAYVKALSNIVGEEVDKKKILMLLAIKALEDKKRRKNSQLINGIIGEGTEKSKMKCNKPKAEAHGSGETGKSHVVKACENGEEKLIRFGQLGVKGSPKKEGESEEYASRRRKFKIRHAKNIARGRMSAAYWANKVKW